MAFCRNCGSKLEENSMFCTDCGTKVEASQAVNENVAAPQATVQPANVVSEREAVPPPTQAASAPSFCSTCGASLEEGAAFCNKCGAKIGAAAVNTATVTPQNNQYQQGYQQQPPYQPRYQQPVQSGTNPFSYIGAAFKKYAVFHGRARRAEYWWFALFYSITYIVTMLIDSALYSYITENVGVFTTILSLVVLFPCWGLCVRRLHDVDKSGWFVLVPIYNIVLVCTAGTPGPNRFGPDPKETSI